MKIIYVVFFLFLNLYIYSQNILPKPDKNLLYSDFISIREAKYLKKNIIQKGYIAMKGEELFIFKQIEPTNFEIRKVNNKIIISGDNISKIEIDSATNEQSGNYENIMFLFYNDNNILNNYSINKKKLNNKDYFEIIPKKILKIKLIEIFSNEDKIEKIILNYFDNSKLTYQFSNTITGIEPDEKYFK